MTLRRAMEKSGKADRIDDYAVSWRGKHYVDVFWELRRFYGDDKPVTPRMLADYCSDSGVLLNRHERDIIYRMDSAFRSALGARKAENEKTIADKAKGK